MNYNSSGLEEEARLAAGDTSPAPLSDIQVLEADRGGTMGCIRMIARRK